MVYKYLYVFYFVVVQILCDIVKALLRLQTAIKLQGGPS